ncbi:MAG TPA: dTMP kinase [Pyrinomonadaceae bacterium]|nr:dTMP kinase [Pyrinomonadaceae bacterium]HQX57106.1 dTMP kinase [Pyrinomonadaceae bacterium]HQY67196.1 dTMP kinase [Pyrinomonadaceae bacterium]HRA39761.1 dTMP kinase [Pyrinomonadaceae bacterium]
MKGRFITFEGIDGSGKSTQLRMLAAILRERGIDVITTCEPGGTPLGKHLRSAFLETEETVAPLAELLLFAADRAQHVEFLIRPSIAGGRVVISDRYADATEAYQGAGRGFPSETIRQVIDLATGGLKPDLTLFFDISVDDAFGRMTARDASGGKRNRMDLEKAEFYQRVRDEYFAIAKREPERFIVIDAARSKTEIQHDVTQAVMGLLGNN